MTNNNGEAAAIAAAATPVRQVTLSSGVILSLKSVPIHILAKAATNVPVPKVPRVYIESQDRHEDNPDDPEYRAALERYHEECAQAQVAAGIMFGTKLALCPPEVEPPDGTEWIIDTRETAEAMGLDIEVHEAPPRARYFDWIKHVACIAEEDYMVLAAIVTSRLAMTDSRVQDVMATFRGHSWRGADSVTPAPAIFAGDRGADGPDGAGDGLGTGAAGGGEAQSDPVASLEHAAND